MAFEHGSITTPSKNTHPQATQNRGVSSEVIQWQYSQKSESLGVQWHFFETNFICILLHQEPIVQYPAVVIGDVQLLILYTLIQDKTFMTNPEGKFIRIY